MLKANSLLYVFVLLLAFAIGLVGTLMASRFVARDGQSSPVRNLNDQPVSAPAPTQQVRLVTVDC